MQWMIVQIDKNTLKQLAKELNNFMPGNVWLKIEQILEKFEQILYKDFLVLIDAIRFIFTQCRHRMAISCSRFFFIKGTDP